MKTAEQASFAALDGMTRAADHADRETPTWSDRAIAYVREFAGMEDGRAFLIEQAREYAEYHGLPLPPDGRAWGAVATRAARLGIIVRDGYGSARSSNNSPKCMWRAA